ncbi:MAG: hypothetical protein ACTSRH_11185 [Promethearchaeota archaeon]
MVQLEKIKKFILHKIIGYREREKIEGLKHHFEKLTEANEKLQCNPETEELSEELKQYRQLLHNNPPQKRILDEKEYEKYKVDQLEVQQNFNKYVVPICVLLLAISIFLLIFYYLQ